MSYNLIELCIFFLIKYILIIKITKDNIRKLLLSLYSQLHNKTGSVARGKKNIIKSNTIYLCR